MTKNRIVRFSSFPVGLFVYATAVLLIGIVFFSATKASCQDYLLGEGDILNINVYDHPDLKTTVRISGNGQITVPLIGQMDAANVSVNDLSEKIEALLADGYIVNPQVSIFVESFRSRKATILGEVNSPGLYELAGYTSLLELISTAGGLTADAASAAIVHRKSSADEKERKIDINLRRLMEGGAGADNIQIIDGDNVFIPKKEVFFVTGEVKKPDSYNYEDGLTVIQALTMAGGLSDKAAPGRIRVIRTIDGSEMLLKNVKMDQPILPSDVIVVPESYF
jgi:polysaccharide biosynthesis/export protein